ncbi:hypothetical protein ACFU44_00615 [Nocardia rhizosphaerihabitans]|uniref:hypothetical protein n=1 Tax=Nocardia rhizosphaerihabitans TaxID=1691570 RepID=UPI003672749D
MDKTEIVAQMSSVVEYFRLKSQNTLADSVERALLALEAEIKTEAEIGSAVRVAWELAESRAPMPFGKPFTAQTDQFLNWLHEFYKAAREDTEEVHKAGHTVRVTGGNWRIGETVTVLGEIDSDGEVRVRSGDGDVNYLVPEYLVRVYG